MEESTTVKEKIYFENLDGLRFLCFLSVFFYHSFYTEYTFIKQSSIYQFVKFDVFGNGNLGVNFFFVLSGFLITYLLIEERKRTGTIHVPQFWMRRILRIWPLFYACVLFGFVIFPMLKSAFGQVPNETANPIFYLIFLNNFDFINNGTPDSSVLGVLWSVAIEEQFYLLWPLILWITPTRHYWVPFLLIISGSVIFRIIYDLPNYHEMHTLSCIGDMAMGAMGAWLMQEQSWRNRMTILAKWKIAAIYLLFFLAFFFRKELLLEIDWMRPFERLLIAFVILLIILEQTFAENSFVKMKRFQTVTNLGKITYGLYCLHFIGILIATNFSNLMGWNTEIWQVMIMDTFIALAVSILIAKISYRFFEHPFLKIKERFAFIAK